MVEQTKHKNEKKSNIKECEPSHKKSNMPNKVFIVSVFVVVGFALFFVPSVRNSFVSSLQVNKEYQRINWNDLLPESDFKALQSPSFIRHIAEGAMNDKIDSPLASRIDNPRTAYEHALISVKVRNEHHNTAVKLPGFIVPIDMQGEGETKEFFIVPYFGACLHLPPPPPNQIVYATFPKGFKKPNLEQPYFVEARLLTKQTKNDIATAAYYAEVDNIYPYTEADTSNKK